MDEATFRVKMARLQREELAPHGLALEVHPLFPGGTLFQINSSRTGATEETILCPRRHRHERDEPAGLIRAA